MKTVAIIGGGVTGLTAAFRLKQRGVNVTVYEAGNRVGGAIQSAQRDGYLAEFGPNSILETSPKISELVHDLGLDEEKIYSDPRAENRYIARGGKPVLVPGKPLDFFASPLFSTRAKARLLLEPLIPRGNSNTEETLENFVLRRLGREFLDYAINPMVAGIYAGDPARLSVVQAFPKIHSLEQRYSSLILGQIFGARERKKRKEISKQSAKKFSFRNGLQTLISSLEKELGDVIEKQNPIRQIEKTGEFWRVSSAQTVREFDAVLLAIPAHRLAQIGLKTPSDFSLKSFEEIHYPPVTSVVFGFRREDVLHPLDGFGVLVPAVENMNILGAIFSSSLFPNRAPAGHVTVTCYVGGCRNSNLALQPPGAVRSVVLQDLRKLLGVSGTPTFEHFSVFPNAIPQYNVGYGQFKNRMREIETACPGLFFAGHSRDGISLGDSIVSGENISQKIRTFVESKSSRLVAF